jgi:endoglucanase
LALQIQMEEAAVLPGFGAVVLPGSTGFRPRRGLFQLNASYVPVQLLLGLDAMIGNRFWSQMAARVPRLIGASAPRGFALDWIAFQTGRGFSLKPLPREQPLASYDAIRVYLWAGMLHPGTPNRRAILRSLTGMRDYLRKNTIPPAAVTEAGVVRNPDGPVGFSGAVIPFLAALKETEALQAQRKRLESEFDAATGLYGRRPRYYDQCLVMFSQGWTENRFGFGPGGSLILNWRQL